MTCRRSVGSCQFSVASEQLRCGVTLLELLIVLALLIAIAAAVGPTVLSALDERAFDSTLDVTGRQMMLARAHAQASGQAVEVVYLNDGARPQVAALLFAVGEESERVALVPSWAQRPLPYGYTIADQPPQAETPGIGGVEDAPVEARSLRLGVFLPDGSAMSGLPRWLSDGDGRVARMNLNPYTGHVEFTRLPPEDLRDLGAAEDELAPFAPWDEQ